MYTKDSNQQQFSFLNNNFFIKPILDQNHIMIKIANSLNWINISNQLSKFYSSSRGRPTKPSRAKVGLLILKHLYKLSDEEVVDFLKRDLYAQYLCNVSIQEAKKFIHSSTLTYFRKQIGSEGIKLIEKELLSLLKKNKLIKGKKLVIDTTVVSSPISYPTDIHLLESLRTKAVKLLDAARQFGAKRYRTYRRAARKTFLTFTKLKRRTSKARRKIQKKLIQFTSRNIRQLKDSLENISKKARNTNAKAKDAFSRKAKDFVKTASKIIQQQKEIYKGKSVKERIVSSWATHIRPMVRGKFPVEVEFGPKILLSLHGKFLFLDSLNFDNVADVTLLPQAIESYQTRFGRLPSQIAADRGFYSKDNYQYCLDKKITKVAIEKKGKPSTTSPPAFLKRLRRGRCAIEAKISLAKRKFGLDRINYRISGGEEIWIRLGLMVMNLKSALAPG